MRYLYQQLIAFFAVILVILMTIGVAFTQMTRQTLQERNYEQLMGYASSVAKISQISDSEFFQQNMTRDEYLQYSLHLAENILSNQDISFAFFKSPKEQIYPLDTAGRAVIAKWWSITNDFEYQFIRRTRVDFLCVDSFFC